jgi:hypothetical protein
MIPLVLIYNLLDGKTFDEWSLGMRAEAELTAS